MMHAFLFLIFLLIMAFNATLQVRIKTAVDALPSSHRLSSVTGEEVESLEHGKTRLQDYAFTQGFALVIESHDKKRRRLRMHCSRHKSNTRNTRKLDEEDRERVYTNVSFDQCKYSVQIKYPRYEDRFIITVLNDEHSHDLSPDPFVFREHKSKDICRDEAMQLGLGLRISSTKYNQAGGTMRTQGVTMTSKEYYNLTRSAGKRTPQEQLSLALKTLEMEGFHVRCLKKYSVVNNIKEKEIIEHFFFCHPMQILL